MTSGPIAAVLPVIDDLPGQGWLSLDDEFVAVHGGAEEVGELFDCVGPAFPADEIVTTAASPHFVRPPRQLLHGFGVEFSNVGAADQAMSILGERAFVECLGRSVSADFERYESDAELLGMDVVSTRSGMRVSFAGGDADGVRPVHLDVVLIQSAAAVGVLWCGDTPEPFDPQSLEAVRSAIATRAAP